MAHHVLLCTRDPLVIEAVEVSAAALEIDLVVADDAAAMSAKWAAAAVRLLGVDSATRWGVPGSGEAFVIGTSPEDLARCSSELGIPVIALPDGAGRLTAVMARAVAPVEQTAKTVAVLGSSGGLGVSTLAAALAIAAATHDDVTVGVDLAPASGGLDLVVGAEAAKGIRWPDLAQARGELGDVVGGLPRVGGAAFLAQGRGGAPPGEEAVRVVLGALARSARYIVVDSGRGPAPASAEQVLIMVGADVRSIAAAQMLATNSPPSGLIVRSGPGRSIPSPVVAKTLGLECVGVIGHDRALPRLAELGLPPLPGPAKRYARNVASLWKRISDE